MCIRDRCGTHVAAMWHPCGTHVAAMWHPRGTHMAAMWHPCGTHMAAMEFHATEIPLQGNSTNKGIPYGEFHK